MSAARSNYQTWLAKAEHDLLSIENNLQAPEIPWDTICFHAQQAAEKFLKAFLVFHGLPPLRTHDLVALLAACVPLNSSLTTRQQDCQKIELLRRSRALPERPVRADRNRRSTND